MTSLERLLDTFDNMGLKEGDAFEHYIEDDLTTTVWLSTDCECKTAFEFTRDGRFIRLISGHIS